MDKKKFLNRFSIPNSAYINALIACPQMHPTLFAGVALTFAQLWVSLPVIIASSFLFSKTGVAVTTILMLCALVFDAYHHQRRYTYRSVCAAYFMVEAYKYAGMTTFNMEAAQKISTSIKTLDDELLEFATEGKGALKQFSRNDLMAIKLGMSGAFKLWLRDNYGAYPRAENVLRSNYSTKDWKNFSQAEFYNAYQS